MSTATKHIRHGVGSVRPYLYGPLDMLELVKRVFGAVELERIDDLNALRQRFVAEGVFIRPFGSIVYLTPALTIAEDELAKLTDAVRRVLAERQ